MRHTCVSRNALFSAATAIGVAAISCVATPHAKTANGIHEPTITIAERLAKDPTGPSSDDDARSLRLRGQGALDFLIADAGPVPSADQKRRIDEVAQQRDAYASHLYWYTNLDEAERAAKASGKPILALRLLGNLTDELSCANSRFFRTALYSNKEVSAELHDRFILYWSAERPAPTITIDFHDGRKIERTVTGNSIHYVLDDRGRPIDAIPGLYAPEPFLKVLREAAALAHATARVGEVARADLVREFHRSALARAHQRWTADFVVEGLPPRNFLVAEATQPGSPSTSFVPADVAMPIAVGKALVERRMVASVMDFQAPTREAIEATPWSSLAASHRHDTHVDDASRALIRSKNPMDWTDASAPHPLSDEDFTRMMSNFENAMTEDTEKNELWLHATIHAWLANDPAMDLADLNTRVYDTLFLTPRSDPWLGLVPPATFTGIENDGVRSN